MLLLSPPPYSRATPVPDQWFWLLRERNAGNVRQGQGPLAAAPVAANVVLLLPPGSVSWHQVALPKVGRSKLRAVLDGLLEDRLLQEPAQVHLALPAKGAPPAADLTWVAACDKAWLTELLRQLEQAGRPVQRILPSVTPQDTPRYWLQPAGDTPWVCSTGPHGVVSLPLPEQATEAAALLQVLRSTHDASTTPTCHAPAAWLHMAQTLWPSLSWQLDTPDTQAQQCLHSDWDLAQFDVPLASRRGWTGSVWHAAQTGWHTPAWRSLRWGLLGLGLVQLTGLNLMAWQERHALQQLHQQANHLLSQTFPHITLVLDAPLQMQREVERLQQERGQLGPRDLEPLLQTLGTPPTSWPVQQLRYTPDEFSVQHPAVDETAQQHVVRTLGHLGWQVQDVSPSGHTFVWREQP